MSQFCAALLNLSVLFASIKDMQALFGESDWDCATAPLRHVNVRRCNEPHVVNSAEVGRTVAIECATVGCDAWATNARGATEPAGLIRVYMAKSVWTLDVPGGGPLRANRFPVRLEDGSAWFAKPAGSVLALRVAQQGYTMDDCGAITEFTYLIDFGGSTPREIVRMPTAFFAAALAEDERMSGFATCPVRAKAEFRECFFSTGPRANVALLRCGSSTDRIHAEGKRNRVRGLDPFLDAWYARQHQ